MGVSSNSNLLSEQVWLKVLEDLKGVSRENIKLIKDFSNGMLRDTEQLKIFLNTNVGESFIKGFKERINVKQFKNPASRDAAENFLKDLEDLKQRPIFNMEWAKIESDSIINQLFTKHPNAKNAVENWVKNQVALGKSVEDIGMGEIKSQIKKVAGGSKILPQILDFADKVVTKRGGKVLLLGAIGGVIFGLWTVEDLWHWLKSRFSKPTTPDNTNQSPETSTGNKTYRGLDDNGDPIFN